MTNLRITPLTGVIGAEIEGVDIARPLSSEEAQDVRTALAEYQVLVFRDQPITPQQQHAFASSLGVVDTPLVDPGRAPAPGITIIESALAKGLTDEWHTDQPYVKVPPMAAMLHAVTLPSRGGDTCWCNMAAAYDALSAPMKDMLDGLTAISNTVRMKRRIAEEGKNFGYLMEDEDIVHPLVRVHPETGRKALYVCQLYTDRIVELKEAESRALLAFLYEHSTSVDFMLRLHWTPHTTVIWDERSTIHYAVGDYDEPRLMHRLILKGTAPFGVSGRAMAA
jgi:alpha-ketoglutarate-dependent taurine dioxygenase